MNNIFSIVYFIKNNEKIMKKKWFTLVETMIVIVIIGLLTIVLFRSYSTITKISAKAENTKVMSTQLALIQSYFQSFVNGAKLDYELYTWDDKKILTDNGWTNEIKLQGKHIVDIYLTGDCFDFTWDKKTFSQNIYWKKCRIETNIDWKTTYLTNPNTVYISNMKFQVLPQNYYTWNALEFFDKEKFWKSQWFWLFGQIWIKNWNEDRVRNTQNKFQYFFNLE